MIPFSAFETEDQRQLLHTGVFICDCGGKISNCLDTQAVCDLTAQIPGVAVVTHEAYPCSPFGRLRISKAIVEQRLDRVLIAGCAPRLVETLYQDTAETAGLERNYLQVVDIREQCAFVHSQGQTEALEKADNLIEIGLARLGNLTTPPAIKTHIYKSALVFGDGLDGLTAALELAEKGILVTLVTSSEHLGQIPYWADEQVSNLIEKQVEAVLDHPQIFPIIDSHISEISGSPGNYHITVSQSGQSTQINVGSILVTNDPCPQALGVGRWYDRKRVKTQAEYAIELEAGTKLNDVVMIFCTETEHCSRVCCAAGIRQALKTRQINPEANITILFRDLYFYDPEGQGEDLIKQAREQGITFFRYNQRNPPVIEEKVIRLHDPLTEAYLEIAYDRVVLAMPLQPDEKTRQLGALLHLPVDQHGFLVEQQIRLRPGRYTDDGIFILGGAHQPANLQETLFQDYLASSRALRFLDQESISSSAPVAQVDPALCTGCGECVPVCSFSAIHLERRQGVLSLSTPDPLRCTGCGDCSVACPSKAISIPGWDDAAILAQITVALRSYVGRPDSSFVTRPAPLALVLACEWSAYAAADIAGVRKLHYPTNVRILRMNCSARFDPTHILWAFLNGAQGVFLGACPLGDCHYGNGNLHATERVEGLQRQLAEHGIDPKRLHLEYLAADDGAGFIKALGHFLNGISESSCQTNPLG